MFCSKCGAKNSDTAKFCLSCGHPFSGMATDSTQDNSMPVSSTSVNYNLNTPIVKKSHKKPIIIGIVAAFLLLCIGCAIFAGINGGSGDKEDKKSVTSASADEAKTKPNDETKSTTSSTKKSDKTTQATSQDKYTVMVYICASNLESEGDTIKGHASNDIQEILKANISDDVNIVLECGGTTNWKNKSIPANTVSRFKIEDKKLVKLEDPKSKTMTREGDLSDFITFCKDEYPAQNYVLVLWNHGGGSPITFGIDELDPKSDGYTDIELGQELKKAGVKFETVVFNACLMCSLEVAVAIEDYAEYMVGAESIIYTPDIYYTNWLAELGNPDKRYYETMVEDYQKVVEQYKSQSSMSVIRLDRIDAVYAAYVDYIKQIKNAIDKGHYSDYVKARSNCGVYSGTDSVDLVTLANTYNTDASSKLVNSISNAVVYTYSSIPYGHGLTVYSPFYFEDNGNIRCYNYNNTRKSLVSLNYDKQVVDFYDSLMTMLYTSYQFDKNLTSYSWYKKDYAALITNEKNSSYASSSALKDGKIEVVSKGGYDTIVLSNSDKDMINYARFRVATKRDNGYWILGEDIGTVSNADGDAIFAVPVKWMALSKYICTVYCQNLTIDEANNKWTHTSMVYAQVNNEPAYIVVQFDQDHVDEGIILGYLRYDYVNDKYESNDKSIHSFADNDDIYLVYLYINDSGEYEYKKTDANIKTKDLVASYKYLNQDNFKECYGEYTYVDVYGNKYKSGIRSLKRISE